MYFDFLCKTTLQSIQEILFKNCFRFTNKNYFKLTVKHVLIKFKKIKNKLVASNINGKRLNVKYMT